MDRLPVFRLPSPNGRRRHTAAHTGTSDTLTDHHLLAVSEESFVARRVARVVHESTKRDDAFVDGEYLDGKEYAVLGDEWRDQSAARRR